MKIYKIVNDPHILNLDIIENFGTGIVFSVKKDRVELLSVPDTIDIDSLKQFISNWASAKTDTDYIAEQQSATEEGELLKILDKYLQKSALTTEAQSKISNIKIKDAEAKLNSGVKPA